MMLNVLQYMVAIAAILRASYGREHQSAVHAALERS
jgi:hypothetical protein